MEKEGRASKVPFDPSLPVHTVWDIGWTDDTAILLFQVAAGEVRVPDSFAANGKAVDWYCDELAARAQKHDLRFGHHWLPHDAQATHLAAGGRTVLEQVTAKLGHNVRILHNTQTEQQGILAARSMFPRLWVDATNCEPALNAWRNFRREWDETAKCFRDAPVKDWTNHYADTLRYLAWVWRDPPPPPPRSKPFTLDAPTFNQLRDLRRRRNDD
jgi:phage terminase large subunit